MWVEALASSVRDHGARRSPLPRGAANAGGLCADAVRGQSRSRSSTSRASIGHTSPGGAGAGTGAAGAGRVYWDAAGGILDGRGVAGNGRVKLVGVSERRQFVRVRTYISVAELVGDERHLAVIAAAGVVIVAECVVLFALGARPAELQIVFVSREL